VFGKKVRGRETPTKRNHLFGKKARKSKGEENRKRFSILTLDS
jgi:hypothetical protein